MLRIDENAAMADAVRIRLYWEDGTVETTRESIDAAVTVIVRQAKDGAHRHFEVTDDIDVDGYVIALELPDDRRLWPTSIPRKMRRRQVTGGLPT